MYQRGNMRPSRVLAKLRAGRPAIMFKSNLDSSRVVEIAGMAGFDCFWTCMEHVPNDYALIERQINAAKVWDMDVIVRVPRGSYSDYVRPLELDAAGIMVPHIMSLKDARNVVRMTRFHPIGRRPIDGGNADGQFCAIDIRTYARQANEQRFLCVQIEDPEPLTDLEAIAGLDGIDIIFFGPGDFAHGIGALGEWNDPRIDEARRRVAAVANAHGKIAGTAGSPDKLKDLLAMGYRFINIGADVVAMNNYCRQLMEAVAGNTTEGTTGIYGKA